MSKFFKALEKVEHEREVAAPVPEAPVATVGPTGTPTAVGPDRPATTVTPGAEREAEPPVPAMPTSAPVYGAPVSREPAAGHAFAWQMEPAEAGEPGEIDDHLVSLLAPTSFVAEQYRAVRLALETVHRERGTRVVAVASPGRGEGRTITSLNLAGALAQAPDARVVLIDADLRHPSIAHYLGLGSGTGLSTYLLDTTQDSDAVLQRPGSIAFTVLPAGATSSMPYELLKSPRMATLLAELRARYDYVLVDTPSALFFPDVGILRDLVDGFVLVARAHRTPRERLQDTLTVLGRERTLGVIFNDDVATGVPAFTEAGNGWRRLMPRSLGVARA